MASSAPSTAPSSSSSTLSPAPPSPEVAELRERIRQLEAALAQASSSLHPLPPTPSTPTAPPHSTLRLGDVAPNFDALTQLGPFNLYAHMADHWLVLFSHPADFTPVCTTELARAAALQSELTARKVKIVALSVDSVEHHVQWIRDIEAINGVQLTYPIIADVDRRVASLYGMLQHDLVGQHPLPSTLPLTVRSVHILGSDRKVKAMIVYPASTGRSFDEILRVIDSLQLSEKYQIATPCEWKYGGSCMVLPSVKDSELPALFPKGVTIVRPWLKVTPFPE